MIIWFDKNMDLHVDKNTDANNSFALSKYRKDEENVMFKAIAVVSGNTVLFTHSQVTVYGARLAYGYASSSSYTSRKHFFNKYLGSIENEWKRFLSAKGYAKHFTIRFRIGETTSNMFQNLGYKYYKESDTVIDRYGDLTSRYVIVEKIV